MVILEIWLFLENLLVLLQHHFRSVRNNFFRVVCNTILGLCETPYWSVKHHFQSVCNSISGVCATLFLECVQHYFRSACKTILGLLATPF